MGESEFLQRRNNRRRRIRARVCETLSSYARGTEAGAEAGAGGGGGGNSSLSDAAHIRVSVGRRRSSGAVADVDAADNVGGISRRSYCADSVSRGPSASLRRAENFRTLAVRGRSSDEKFASIGGNWTSRQRWFSLSLSLSLSPPPFLSPTLINQGSHLCPPTMTSFPPWVSRAAASLATIPHLGESVLSSCVTRMRLPHSASRNRRNSRRRRWESRFPPSSFPLPSDQR